MAKSKRGPGRPSGPRGRTSPVLYVRLSEDEDQRLRGHCQALCKSPAEFTRELLADVIAGPRRKVRG